MSATPMSEAAKALASITKEPRKQLHISGVNMLNDCGQRFFYRYVMGIRRPPAAYVLVGKATDEVVSQNLKNKITTGELLPRKEVIELADSEFEFQKNKTPIELDPDERKEGRTLDSVLVDAHDKTLAVVGLHHDQVAPNLLPTEVHRSFSINMDKFLRDRARKLHEQARNAEDPYFQKTLKTQARALNVAASVGMDFAGEYDIVENMTPDFLSIRDTKTSGKSPNKSLMDGSDRPGVADDSDQLTAYACASAVIDGRLPTEMTLDYLIYTPKKHDLKYVPTKTSRTMSDVQVFLNRFANAVQAYRTGMFVPAKADWWGCSEKCCGYWDMCPYSKKPKLIQITKSPE